MAELKKLLIISLGLFTAMALTACDVDEESADGGTGGEGGGGDVDMGIGGAGGVGGGGGETYGFVYMVDTSADLNAAGTPGADICQLLVECDGAAIPAGATTFNQGEGDMCENIGDDVGGMCSAKRNDPARAVDAGDSCEPGSAPQSDYMSMGQNGDLSVDYGRDLQGCTITVIEHDGNDDESYDVYVCQEAGGANCLNDDDPIISATGNASADVPAAQ